MAARIRNGSGAIPQADARTLINRLGNGEQKDEGGFPFYNEYHVDFIGADPHADLTPVSRGVLSDIRPTWAVGPEPVRLDRRPHRFDQQTFDAPSSKRFFVMVLLETTLIPSRAISQTVHENGVYVQVPGVGSIAGNFTNNSLWFREEGVIRKAVSPPRNRTFTAFFSMRWMTHDNTSAYRGRPDGPQQLRVFSDNSELAAG